jgi:septum formation protein
MRLVLASQSARRAELLLAAGYVFDVQPAAVDESALANEAAADYVERVARLKADQVARQRPDDLVLAADTVVVIDGLQLGKPSDDEDAAEMLRRLSGRTHEVLTGVTVGRARDWRTQVASTLVHFTHLSAEVLTWYVESGEPRDKAGAYGIQGLASRFVDRIEGSYTNVVGLPVALVTDLLRAYAPLATFQKAPDPVSTVGSLLAGSDD